MTHDARAVANTLIGMADQEGADLSPIQVMKLVYFCHAWMLGIHGQPLIKQMVIALEHGPAIVEIVKALRKHGYEPARPVPRVPRAQLSEKEQDLIQQVYNKWGHLSGIKLCELASEDGTPWHQVWTANRCDSPIPHHLLRDYYAREAKVAGTAAAV